VWLCRSSVWADGGSKKTITNHYRPRQASHADRFTSHSPAANSHSQPSPQAAQAPGLVPPWTLASPRLCSNRGARGARGRKGKRAESSPGHGNKAGRTHPRSRTSRSRAADRGAGQTQWRALCQRQWHAHRTQRRIGRGTGRCRSAAGSMQMKSRPEEPEDCEEERERKRQRTNVSSCM
jgi:hypothetical protein